MSRRTETRVVLALLATLAFATPASAQTTQWVFDLHPTAPEVPEGDYYKPRRTGFIKFYPALTTLTMELPGSGGQILSGTARILDFHVPGNLETTGMFFSHELVPGVITGTITVDTGTNTAEIDFPAFQIDFKRGSSSATANPGSFMLALSTDPTTAIPPPCDGIASPDPFPGELLDTTTGELRLTGFVCPYNTTTQSWNEAYRLQLDGVLPEPGSAALLASGAALLALLARWRA